MTKDDFPRCRTCERWNNWSDTAGECKKAVTDPFQGEPYFKVTETYAALMTGPDFGCIHHSELESTEDS